MRVVVVAGGTGLVGSALVAQLVDDSAVERVVCVGRRPHPHPSDKIQSRVIKQLSSVSASDLASKDACDAFCALGTTLTAAGSREAFLDIEKRAVLAFARAARDNGVQRFLLVSSVGADARSPNFQLRTKGEVEDAVRELGFPALHVLRPAFLDGERMEPRPGEKLGLALANGVSAVVGNRWRLAPIKDDVVARAMVRLSRDDTRGVFVHESRALQALGGT